MNEWQDRFAQKLETVRSVTREWFEVTADAALTPIYKELSDFTNRHHVRATAPLKKTGIRTFKFAMTENTYVLITFRHTGLQCECQTEVFVPGHKKLSASIETTELCELDKPWCQRVFQQALDRFLDTLTGSLGGCADVVVEAVPA
jgi:hypothetical protein